MYNLVLGPLNLKVDRSGSEYKKRYLNKSKLVLEFQKSAVCTICRFMIYVDRCPLCAYNKAPNIFNPVLHGRQSAVERADGQE